MTPARSRGPRLHLIAVVERFIRFAASACNVFDRFKRGRVYESTPFCSSLYCPGLLSSACTGRFNLQPKRLAPSSPGRGSLNILQSAPCASLHQMFATGKIVDRDLCRTDYSTQPGKIDSLRRGQAADRNDRSSAQQEGPAAPLDRAYMHQASTEVNQGNSDAICKSQLASWCNG